MPDQLKNLSEAELEDIRRRCEQATPGPWQSFIEGRDHTSGCSFIMTGRGKNRGSDIELTGATPADHDFIAHARQDVPRLLEEISQLTDFSLYARRERERLNQERTAALGLQRELNRRLAEIERELSAIDAYTAAKGDNSPRAQSHLQRYPSSCISKRQTRTATPTAPAALVRSLTKRNPGKNGPERR